MQIDPSLIKLWHAWLGWWSDVPYWDPYGGALALLLTGFVSGYIIYRVLHI